MLLRRVKMWDRYFYIDSYGQIDYNQEQRDCLDDMLWEVGNYFATKLQAMNSDIYKAFKRNIPVWKEVECE